MADSRAARLLREVVDCEPDNLPPYNVSGGGTGWTAGVGGGGGGRSVAAAPVAGARCEKGGRAMTPRPPSPQEEEVRLVIEECHEHYALMRDIFR